jgi:sensor domain CHASE-containing protein
MNCGFVPLPVIAEYTLLAQEVLLAEELFVPEHTEDYLIRALKGKRRVEIYSSNYAKICKYRLVLLLYVSGFKPVVLLYFVALLAHC